MIGIAVCIDNGDHRYAELARFGNGNGFLVGVDDKQNIGQAANVLDAANGMFDLVALARKLQQFFFGETLVGFSIQRFFKLPQTLQRFRNCLPVGQRSAQPAVIDVMLRALPRAFSDGFRGLALGADKQQAAAFGDCVRYNDQRLMQQRHRLRQIDDMNIVPRAKDVGPHLRVPAVFLMAKMYACLQELAHGEIRQCHDCAPFPVRPPRMS